MLVWRVNMAWKSGYPNQCLRLGYDAKRDRTLGARFRESASDGSPLTVIECQCESAVALRYFLSCLFTDHCGYLGFILFRAVIALKSYSHD